MYEKILSSGIIEVHTTINEFTELYKKYSAKEMSEIYGIPQPTIVRKIQILGIKKRK